MDQLDLSKFSSTVVPWIWTIWGDSNLLTPKLVAGSTEGRCVNKMPQHLVAISAPHMGHMPCFWRTTICSWLNPITSHDTSHFSMLQVSHQYGQRLRAKRPARAVRRRCSSVHRDDQCRGGVCVGGCLCQARWRGLPGAGRSVQAAGREDHCANGPQATHDQEPDGWSCGLGSGS